MRLRTQRPHWQAGLHVHLNGNVMSGAYAGRRHLRCDLRSVRHAIGIRRPAAALLADCVARDVARTDDHRESECVSAGFVGDSLDIADMNAHLLSGSYVRDRLREDVRTLLIEKCRYLAGVPRGV